MKTDRNALTDTEEMLIEKYFDDETSFFERFSAKRLLARQPAARRYFDKLASSQKLLQKVLPVDNTSLWFRISSRLHAEEKSAVLLGKRDFRSESAPFSRIFVRGGLVAAMTAVALFMVVPRTGQQGISGDQLAGSSAPVAIQRGIPMAVPASVGVDWMRSDGRLQVIHEPSDRAPMIFVKRRFNRTGPVIKTERNSQGIIMKDGGMTPQGLAVSSGR